MKSSHIEIDWSHLGKEISNATAEPFILVEQHALGGGCINSAYQVTDGERRYFIKFNDASKIEMFAAETEALRALQDTATVRVPEPICWGVTGDAAYIVIEYLEFGRSNDISAAALGERLALLHQHTGKRYGWHRDNTIGSTPQINTADSDWLTFWRERRLNFQLRLAEQHGFDGRLLRKGEQLANSLALILADHQPAPSLLHGDLWSGNHATLRDGTPVIFDPASYYGDRETDLAMTELFGGFSPRFYAAYKDRFPLEDGYQLRKTLYNLYHILNHANLFGGGYAAQAEHMIDTLLSEVA